MNAIEGRPLTWLCVACLFAASGSDDFASLLTAAIAIGTAIGFSIGLVLPATSTVYDAMR